jgi:hypothetical protein
LQRELEYLAVVQQLTFHYSGFQAVFTEALSSNDHIRHDALNNLNVFNFLLVFVNSSEE